MGSDELILEKIYREIVAIRERLEALERIIIPEEKLSSKELEELKRLREEALKGEIISWDDVKRGLENKAED